MHHGKRPAFALISFAFFLPLAQAGATTLTWSSYSAWKSNVTGSIELNFGQIVSGTSYNSNSGITLKPLSGPSLPFLFTGPYTGGYQLTGGKYANAASLFGPSTGSGSITIGLPGAGENALLLGLGSMGSATSITVALSDGESFNVPATAAAVEFLGLSISHDVTWVTVSASSQPVVNDFFFATSQITQDATQTEQPAPALEGSTITMLGGGLLSLFGARRKLFPAKAAV
jgi:hypothetical protein